MSNSPVVWVWIEGKGARGDPVYWLLSGHIQSWRSAYRPRREELAGRLGIDGSETVMGSVPASETQRTPAERHAGTPIEVSIVWPCRNEELVIGEFVVWCFQGLKKANVSGEVLIIDSSTDRSPEIAEAHGATVIRVPKCGLGQAYIDSIAHIRGRYVIMGDCDLTYDFREIAPFVEALRQGSEFVMGTRLRGHIEPGSMPLLHRYFGTPATTATLNFIYGSRFSDIHCGMRAMTLDALHRIGLQSMGWEYASEMVLKAVRLGLRCSEVPIRFYKDREGRFSHHRRSGWFSPWLAGWTNLRLMFLFAPEFFLLWPGVFALVVGLLLSVGLARGPVSIGAIGFNLHWMLLGLTLATLGYSALHLALLAKVFYDFEPGTTQRILRLLTYDRGMIAGSAMMAIGVALEMDLFVNWILQGLRLQDIYYSSVFGLLLIILGFQTITSTLILQMVAGPRRLGECEPRPPVKRADRQDRPPDTRDSG